MHGKQVLITGATTGIGLAAAEALAARGANVALVGRNATALRIAAARVTAAQSKGGSVDTLIADLSSQAAVRRLAAEVLDRPEPVDVGRDGFEAGNQAPDLIARPQVEHLLLRAVAAESPVDLGLAPRDERCYEQQAEREAQAHRKSRVRKDARPSASTITIQAAA